MATAWIFFLFTGLYGKTAVDLAFIKKI